MGPTFSAVAEEPRTATFSGDHRGGALVCAGNLSGSACVDYAVALDRLVASCAPHVQIDLARVEDWSALAQAVTLIAARRLAASGRELVLLRPSAQLRRGTDLIDVFGLVATSDAAAASG